jgi:alpha-1,6-mannosyltransferase
VTRVGESVTAMKAAMVAFEAIAIALLLALLVSSGQPGSRILAYAWHPLPVWEFAGSGHIDAALIALVALGLWGRVARARWLTGLALAGGTLIKLYPAVLFPALWRRGNWRMPVVFAAAVALAYLPFLAVGWRVFGFLPGYMAEEGFATGGGFYLLSALRTIAPFGEPLEILYLAAAAALLLGLAAYVVFSRAAAGDPVFGAALLATAFMFLVSPHYPWYFAWLLAFVCFIPPASVMWLTVASFLLYLVPMGSQLVRDRHRLIVESALYVPFVVLAAIDLWRWHLRGLDREKPGHGDNAR